MQATTDSSSSRMVTTSTRTPGSRRTSSRVVSMPESSPRWRSISTTSTDPGASARACWASAACATTSMPPSEPSRPAIPSRNTGWSSTIATRIDPGTSACPGTLGHLQRQHGLDRGAGPGQGVDLEPAALLLGALAHRATADPGAGVLADAAPRVGDQHAEDAQGGGGAHRALARTAVPADVDQRLADDAVRRGRHLRVDPLFVLQVEPHRQSVLGVASRELLEGGTETELVEHRRQQAVRHGPHVGDPLVELVLERREQLRGRGRVGLEEVARATQPQPQAGQRRAEPVVDLTADDATLGEPGARQPLAGLLDL